MQNKVVGFLLVLICAMALSGCGKKQDVSQESGGQKSTSTREAVQPSTDDELAKDTALNNPATVYCLQQEGKFAMRKALDGTAEGMCTLPTGIICEVWAYYKGECPKGAKVNTEETASTTETAVAETEMPRIVTSTEMAASSTAQIAKSDEETIDDKPKPKKVASAGEIVLVAEPGEEPGEIVTSWKTDDAADFGYIVMLSGNDQIEYPTKYFHALKNPESHSFVWTGLVKDKTYYFRVCLAEGESCGEYSSVVSAVAQ